MTTMTARRNDEGRIWLHFPDVPGAGCEGVLVLLASRNRLRALLVDGSADQIGHLQNWSLQSRDPGALPLEITWVISHYHRDHYRDGHALLREPTTSSKTPHIEDHVVDIFCPAALSPPSSFADEAATAFKELGPRLDKIRQAALKDVPRVDVVPLGRMLPIFKERDFEIEVHGGPRRGEPRSPNSRSLIVMGFAHDHFDTNDVPFTFILPGDAEPTTWKQLEALIDEHEGLAAKLPIAILKLAHHGATDCNPESVLQRLFGTNNGLRSQQLAVRIFNRSTRSNNAAGLESTLSKMSVSLHDTRDHGELWVSLRQGGPLIKTTSCKDPKLGLPAAFQFQK